MSQLAFAMPDSLPVTRAVSGEALEIEKARTQVIDDVQFGSPGRSKPLNELNSVVSAYGLQNSATGLTTYQRARTFLAALPSNIPHPEFSVDPDGEIAIEWYVGDDVLSISLNVSGRFSFVSEFDGTVTSGSDFFCAAIPSVLLEKIAHFKPS